MKKTKFLLTVLLVMSVLAITVLSILSISAYNVSEATFQATGETGVYTERKVNVTWDFNETTGELVISGYGYMDWYEYENLTPWYKLPVKIVTIEEGVTSVGRNAFAGMNQLKRVNLATTVNSIETYAFRNCVSLSQIAFPDSIHSIGQYAFENCISLTEISFKSNLLTVESYAFSDCINLEVINIPSFVEFTVYICAFDGTAFYNNPKNWDGNLLYLGQTLLACDNAGGVYNIREGTTEILYGVFSKCAAPTEIIIPSTVREIPNSCFSGNASITSVTLSKGLEKIGDMAFAYTAIESIVIPDSVNCISSFAFYDTPLYNNSKNWDDGVLYIGKYLIKANVSGEYTIREDTLVIADMAFNGSENLVTLNLLGDLRHIGAFAFYSCPSLRYISLSENIKTFGQNAFYDSYKLKEVVYYGSPENFRLLISESSGNDVFYWLKVSFDKYPNYVWEIKAGYYTDFYHTTSHYIQTETRVAATKKSPKKSSGDIDISSENPLTLSCGSYFAATGFVVALLAGGLVPLMMKKKKD